MSEIILTEDHRYLVDGVEYPSVTQILEGAGLIETSFFTEDAAIRGEHVHFATQLVDEDDLDYDTLIEQYKPYVRAYERFCSETDYQVISTEKRLYEPVYGFCGTYDRLAWIQKQCAVVDFKTGAYQAWWPLQAEAYRRMAIVNGHDVPARFSLELKSDGTYRLHGPYTDLDDWLTFIGALNVYRWKVKHGK